MDDPQAFPFKSVLVVDDEPDNLEVVAETLEFFGLQVTTAPGGAEGLAVLQTLVPDLILLDLSMPQVSGWELRARAKALPRLARVPVVALSAHAMSGDRERAFDAGFDGYLTKPVNVATLIRDIQTAIAEKQRYTAAQHVPIPPVLPQPVQEAVPTSTELPDQPASRAAQAVTSSS